jgi:hypothetical protein
MKMDVLIVHLQANVLNVIPHHGIYFQEIVMKSVQLELMLMMEVARLVILIVLNVTEEKQIIVILVQLNTITETHVSTHVLMENMQTHQPYPVITVMKPV